MSQPTFYNAHHSPVGAFATLTLGEPGARGGLGHQLGAPAGHSVFVGCQVDGAKRFVALPFFAEAASGDEDRYQVEGAAERAPSVLSSFAEAEIERRLTPSLDEWCAGDLRFRIVSPPWSVPEPGSDAASEKAALLPAITAELTLDNSAGTTARKVFFGFSNDDRTQGMRHLRPESGAGFAVGDSVGVQTDHPKAWTANHFSVEQILLGEEPGLEANMLGETTLLVAEAAPGEVLTLRLAIGWMKTGWVTTGLRCRYAFTEHFDRLESVLGEGLATWAARLSQAELMDARLSPDGLSADQAWTLSMAIRSHYGSTQALVDESGRPIWMVNEGEYRMMNTFDLTADQVFFELLMNPWTVRNELDLFADRYAYHDEIGGQRAIAFTHDMGVANQFSPPGYSSYERPGLDDCFSYMSHEELVNWVCCAGAYLAETDDTKWLNARRDIFEECLQSLLLRDHPDPEQRDGIMSIDSGRCEGGAEITTYDSLDTSLGQARNSAYLAGKTAAAYAILARFLGSDEAREQVRRALKTLADSADAEGCMASVLEEGGHGSRIIPVIEGLIFFREAGVLADWEKDETFVGFLEACRRHLAAVLKPGVCLFDDGGWKLSSTANNSWLSKIYLCQHIARSMLGGGDLRAYAEADRAHNGWILNPDSRFWCWSDQMVSGRAMGSRYYPRGVTSILWLKELR
ncbi:MAG: glycoside hydrolase family 52 protein [Fimbriimonadaceae bacterium]|nr:glycoside hydrolase family 52 protein [Fimbriimonadaceae bacterium]